MDVPPSIGVGPTGSPASGDRLRFRAEHLFVLLGILVVLGLVALFAARPLYREFKRGRAVRLVAEVPTLVKGSVDDQREAGRRIRVALGLAPQDPAVLRATAKFCALTGQREGLTYWRHLLGSGHATREDKLEAAELALVLTQLDFAAAELEPLVKADPRDVAALRLLTQLHLRQGRLPRAVASAKAAFEAAPTDTDLELTLAQLQARSGSRELRAEGRRRILKLAASEGPAQSAALAMIVGGARVTRAEAETLLRAIESRTNPSVRLQLQAASIRLGLKPDEKTSIIRQHLAPHVSSTNDSDRADAAAWAISEGGAVEVLELVPSEPAQLDSLGLSLRLEAAAELGRWEELDRLATNAIKQLPKSQVHSLNAVRLARQQKDALALGELTEAVNACGKNSRELVLVAVTAERIGRTNVAVEAWHRLLDHPLRGLTAARQVVRLAAPLDDLASLRDGLDRLNQLNPGNPLISRRLAYLNVLLSVRIPEAQEIFREIEAGVPDAPIARLGLAFAQWRLGDAPGALATAEREPLDFDKLPHNWRAVYVGLLAAADRRAAARDFARKVDLSKLRPLERNLVEPSL